VKSRIKIGKRSRLSIPQDFQVEKYSVCKKWGVKEWSNAISLRVSLRNEWNKLARKIFDIEDIDMVYGYLKTKVSQIIKDPHDFNENNNWSGMASLISDQSVADLFEDAEEDRLLSSSWRTDYLKWRSMPAIELYYYDRGLNESLIERIEKTPSWVMKREELGQGGIATINVSMDGDSEEIVKEFRNWLKRTKSKMNLPNKYPSFDKNSFSDWYNDRVLPCFDLELYKIIHHGWFPMKDMAEALFPHRMSSGENIVEMVRRTTIPNSLRIVSAGVATSLVRMLKA
jgi:hypothetical protein